MGKYKGIAVEKEAIEILKFFRMEYDKENNVFKSIKGSDMIVFNTIDNMFIFKSFNN